VQYTARFLVDATGPRGFTHRTLNLPEAELPNLPSTETLYAHFEGVRTFAEVNSNGFEGAPYPVDKAAVHHIFDGGWIWILRFNNGVTSAGVAARAGREAACSLERGEVDWKELLRRLPSVREQFRDAQAVTPFRHHPRLAFRSGRWTGEQWTQLPSASAFIDPLLSTGFPLTLLGISRLARAIEEDWGHPRFIESLRNIADANERDLLAAEQLVSALYAQMHDFPVFRALSLIYFAAASFSECARRLGFAHLDEGFLLHRNARFKAIVQLCARARAGLQQGERQQFIDEIIGAIEPINIVGLGSAERLHWYPADLQCLFAHAGKLGATDHEITAMIDRMMVHA
jgi:FADH2 O2-dependent halogenase